MSWDEQDYGTAQGEERARDAKIDAAKKLVLEFLSNNDGVFYIKQLQVYWKGFFIIGLWDER
jgi:hypothetical protein